MSATYKDGFYIAYVGDGKDAEPIRIQDNQWYSIGCADPHSIDSIEVVRELTPPTAVARAEDNYWRELREQNYQNYKREYRKTFGREPGHRRWPQPADTRGEL